MSITHLGLYLLLIINILTLGFNYSVIHADVYQDPQSQQLLLKSISYHQTSYSNENSYNESPYSDNYDSSNNLERDYYDSNEAKENYYDDTNPEEYYDETYPEDNNEEIENENEFIIWKCFKNKSEFKKHLDSKHLNDFMKLNLVKFIKEYTTKEA